MYPTFIFTVIGLDGSVKNKRSTSLNVMTYTYRNIPHS